MQNIWSNITSFAQSPVFSVASFVLAVVGVILTIHFYRKGRRYKALSYIVRSDRLIEKLSDRFPKLKIIFGDEEIEALTVTRVALWNSGSESIRGEDMAKSDPLRIELAKVTKLLNAEVIVTNNAANVFTLSSDPDPHKIILSFDFINPRDGVILSVIHSGSQSVVKLAGSVIGVRHLTRRMPSLSIRSLQHQYRFPSNLVMSLFMGGFGAASVVLAFWSHTLPAKILIVIFGCIYLLIGLLFPLMERQTLPKGLIIGED